MPALDLPAELGPAFSAAGWLFGTSAVLAVLGLAVWWAVKRRWEDYGRFLPVEVVKVFAKSPTALAAAAAWFGAGAAAADRASYSGAAAAAILCAVSWYLAEAAVDAKVKAAGEGDKDAVRAAKAESTGLRAMLDLFRDITAGKVARLQRAARDAGPAAARNLDRLADALAPADHVADVLASLAAYLEARWPDDGGPPPRIRVGLYANVGGGMAPIEGYDSKVSGIASYKSHAETPGPFRLDCVGKPSAIVECARTGKTVVVADCIAAAAGGEFEFYRKEHPEYLKSLAAWFVGDICLPTGAFTLGVLVLNADRASFFGPDRLRELESTLSEFGARIRLELLLGAALRKAKPQ